MREHLTFCLPNITINTADSYFQIGTKWLPYKDYCPTMWDYLKIEFIDLNLLLQDCRSRFDLLQMEFLKFDKLRSYLKIVIIQWDT